MYGTCADGSYCPAHFSRKNLQPRGGCPGFPSSTIQLLAQKPLLCSTCGLDHGRIEVPNGTFHSLQLLRYLTQEQDVQISCSMLFQHPAVFAWKHLRLHGNFASPCEEKLRRSKPSKSALSIEPWAHVQKQKPPFQIISRSNITSAEHLKSFSHSAPPQLKQKRACRSVSFDLEEQIYCVQRLHMNSTQQILSLSGEPD